MPRTTDVGDGADRLDVRGAGGEAVGGGGGDDELLAGVGRAQAVSVTVTVNLLGEPSTGVMVTCPASAAVRV